jgi:hypothetical protein
MTGPIIQTPKGKVFTYKTAKGDVKAKLEWDTNFQPKWQKRYSRAQRFVDSEVLRLSEKYTPLLTSMLIKSGILGTEIGSGLVQWIAPYARPQYFSARTPGSQTGPLRGPHWFERMKFVSGRTIINGAKRIAGGG